MDVGGGALWPEVRIKEPDQGSKEATLSPIKLEKQTIRTTFQFEQSDWVVKEQVKPQQNIAYLDQNPPRIG